MSWLDFLLGFRDIVDGTGAPDVTLAQRAKLRVTGDATLTDDGEHVVLQVGTAAGVPTHASTHAPDAADAIPTATAVGLDAASTSAEGNAPFVARSNHTHAIDVATGALTTVQAGDAAADGTAVGLARRDHQHAVDGTGTLTAVQAGDTTSDGVATGLARKDHRHAVAAAAPVNIGTANAEGASTAFARANHVHAHGDQTSGTLHAAATTSVNGFMSSADKQKLEPVAAYTVATANATPVTAATVPVTDDSVLTLHAILSVWDGSDNRATQHVVQKVHRKNAGSAALQGSTQSLEATDNTAGIGGLQFDVSSNNAIVEFVGLAGAIDGEVRVFAETDAD